MAKHEFGIMKNNPKPSLRYDAYEPQKYNSISVDDDYIEQMAPRLNNVEFYWHCLDMPAKGIAYCGITLIPPTSMEHMIEVIKTVDELSDLKQLLQKAFSENKWVIHFGL